MEKYFIVTEESALFGEYKKYLANIPVLNKQVKEFMQFYGMETDRYACTSTRFYFCPTKTDLEKFKNQLFSKCEADGKFWGFKKNSKVGKDWIALKAEVINRPWVGMYFNDCCGRTSSRIFEIDGIIYCSFKNEYDKMETPKGFKEIKGSEFFKVIEDNEDKFY